jgi:toxin ParE1/3/4
VIRILFSPRAEADLDEIWEFTARRWDKSQAERYIRGLRSAVESLSENPHRGSDCDAIRPGYRELLAGSHVVFYRITGSELSVIRILHQSMDVDTLFDDAAG